MCPERAPGRSYAPPSPQIMLHPGPDGRGEPFRIPNSACPSGTHRLSPREPGVKPAVRTRKLIKAPKGRHGNSNGLCRKLSLVEFFHDGVEVNKESPGHGDNSHLEGLARLAEPVVNGLEHRIVP